MGGDNLEHAYTTLHLKPGASLGDVKRAYRALVKVWHPDLFSQTPHLQPQALEKFQAINHAYTTICRALLQSNPPPAQAQSPVSTATPPPKAPGTPSWVRRTLAQTGNIPAWAIALVAFVILRLLSATVLPPSLLWPVSQPSTPSTLGMSSPPGLSQPPRPQEHTLSPPVDVPPAQASHDTASQPPVHDTGQVPAALGYFTVGSTQAEVLAVQGPPTHAEAYIWEYGGSRVYFRHGKVTHWEVWPRAPLKVRLQPASAVHSTQAYFTIGSTKDEVLAIQGTPSRFGERVWEYGQSRIYFNDDRVTRWHEWRGSPLKARLTPSSDPAL